MAFTQLGILQLKGPVQCFSMQVVMNKCFLQNPEKKNWPRFVIFLRILIKWFQKAWNWP